MDQSVRNLLNKKMKLGGQELNVSDVLLLAAITVLAVWVRTAVRSFVAQDWTDYWSLWLEELRAGGFKALAGNFYDYAPPVMYLLYLITLLPINSMTAFKAFCCMLDFVGAGLIGNMVTDCTGSKKRGMLAYGVFLFLPTVILNAAVWSQCDIIYTLLILECVNCLMKNKKWAGMWFYGIFPAWLAGRPFMELLGIYAFQGGKDRWSLSIKFPNIYQIIGNNFFLDEYVKAGMLLILGILMLVMCYMAYQKVRISKEFVILLVVFFGMLTTYFIPHMHERYLYLTDAFLLIYTLIRVRRFPLFVTASFLTVVGYGQYLTKQAALVSYGALAFIQLALLVLISLDVYRYLHDPANVLEGGTLESDRIESERTEGRAGL